MDNEVYVQLRVIEKEIAEITDKINAIDEKINSLIKQKEELEKESVTKDNAILLSEIQVKLQELEKDKAILQSDKSKKEDFLIQTLDKAGDDISKESPMLSFIFGFEKKISQLSGVEKALDILQADESKTLNEKLEKLEYLRNKYINKQIIHIDLAILSTAITIASFVFLNSIEIATYISIIFVIFAFFEYSSAFFVDKEFERSVKYALISTFNEESKILNCIVGKRAKIKWGFDYCSNNIEKMRERYEIETGLKYDDLDARGQIEYENEKLLSDEEILFGYPYMVSDDNFSGICEGVKFLLAEYNYSDCSKVSFRGIILKLMCSVDYKKRLVINQKAKNTNSIDWNSVVAKGLNEISVSAKNIDKDFKIYTNDIHFVNEVFTPNFINFINKLGKNYTYVFANGDLYLIKATRKDLFKMGMLYKNVNDPVQFESFGKDVNEILDIVSLAKNIEYLEKPTEKEIACFDFVKK